LTLVDGCTRLGLKDWERLDARPGMTLGSWMAISGAAVSPGLGGATRPGIAALAMMAGLRLGYWWECRGSRGGKYRLLLRELLGRFDIEPRAPWFLSDGGHFENTGAYALLRERCALVVLADCGADPRYAFGDLENLVRKARIDLQADIRFLKPKAPLNRGWEAFGSLSDIASSESSASLALARIDYAGAAAPGHLVVVKPTMSAGLPVDLVNFKADNPAFPQEPTTDQFFDEAQWESYFRLGSVQGGVLTGDVLGAVADVAARCFEPDDGALTAAAQAHPAAAAMLPAKRLPARIVATGAVTASVSLGAIASLGLTAFQAINGEARQRREEQKTDPAEVKELSKLYADLLAAKRDERGKATVNLAVALGRLAEQVCNGPRVKGYRASPQLNTILVEARRSCADAALADVPACRQFTEDLPTSAACLQPRERPSCVPQYWIRDYADDPGNCRELRQPASAQAPGAAAAPAAATPVAPVAPPASVAAPAPRTRAPAALPSRAAPSAGVAGPRATAAEQPCAGKTIYIQIHGPEQRELARTLRAQWQALGATVPRVEDVLQSARQDRRAPPPPVTRPTLIVQDETADACVEKLKATPGALPGEAASAWRVRPLPPVLQSRASAGVIEAWLPPKDGATAGR
jgi:hypothetical protein